MAEQHVRIAMKHSGRGAVWLDGVKVQNVRSVKASAAVDEANVVTIEILPSICEYEGPAEAKRYTREEICRAFHVPTELLTAPVEYGIGAWCRYNETHAPSPASP